MKRFVTYEHEDNLYEPAAMTEKEFREGGRDTVDGAGEYVWQYAPDAETAVAQHCAKHAEWAADVEAGRDVKHTY